MKKTVLLLAIMSVVILNVKADEYIDPVSKVVYTYEPGSGTAMVKVGYEEVIHHGEKEVVYHSGSPDAAGDVTILDRFSIGTTEYVVTSIGENAFRENGNIKSIIIPETVTDIGAWAFSNCNNLISVQFPGGITRIASGLFFGCGNLASIVIPSSVYSIGTNAFARCSSLVSLTLPASLTYAGTGAFDGTPWYASMYDKAPDGPFYIGPLLLGYKGDKPTGELVIKEGTTCVGYRAFANCNGLTNITVPPSIAYVDFEAFYNCTSLNAVHITDLAAWCGIEFQDQGLSSSSNPLYYAHHLYLDGKEVTDLVIPESVTSIGNYAFDYCTDLTSVTIPDGVTNIGTCAFRGCSNLTNVAIPPSVTTIGSNTFIWCKKIDTVHISDLATWCNISFDWTANPLYYGAHLYLGDKEVTDLTIPDGVTTIGNGAFIGCSYLSNVIIPASVKSIDSRAFFNCWGLESIISWIEEPFEIMDDVFELYDDKTDKMSLTSAILYVPKGCKERYESTAGWSRFTNIREINGTDILPQNEYRPFVEEGKVWVVKGSGISPDGSPMEPWIKYCYLDGDTIIGGQTCKRMMCVTNDNASPQYIGAWYEQDKKVYYAEKRWQQFKLLYDFTLSTGDTVPYSCINIGEDVQVTKMSGGIPGFKGTYYNLKATNYDGEVEHWLEGVGSEYYPWLNVLRFWGPDGVPGGNAGTLLACFVGDDVIYYNSEENDPYVMGARRRRFDFTHTTKIQPKARKNSDAAPLYGEYNDQQLCINLDPLDDTYLVCITDESGKTVYGDIHRRIRSTNDRDRSGKK